MEKQKLPKKLEEKLKKDFQDEEILIVLSSDITAKGLYGKEWLVVTSKKLLVFSVDKLDVNILSVIELDSIKKIESVNLVGSGVLEIDTGEHIYRVISYSDAKNADFCQAVDDIKDLLSGKSLIGKDRTKHRKICKTCSRPIPQDMNKCPRCTERRKTLFRILNFSRPYKKLLLFVFLTMILGTGFGLATPYMSKLFIDFILKPDSITGIYVYAKWLPLAALVLLVAYAGQLFFEGIRERLSGSMGFRTVYDVRAAIYKRLQELSLSFFDKHQTGAILTRVNQDTGELQRFLVDFLPLTMESIFMLIGVGTFLFILSWQLTIFIFIPIVATVLFLKKIFPNIRTYFHRFFQRRAKLSALVNDSISGMRVIKVFGQESVEMEKFAERSGDYRDAGVELTRKWSIYHPILHFFIWCGVVIVWFGGGKLVFLGKMSVGSVVAYSGYLMMFYRPVFMLTRMAQMITNSLAAAERVFDVIDTELEIKDEPDAVNMPHIKGKIEFKDVTFGYNKFKPVIKDFRATIYSNEMIGLVGKSGAGKSTIINLICRLYDVNKGGILIDGIDIRKIKYSDLKSQIGVVIQETFLFNGTIFNNIAYAKPDTAKEEVIEAAIAANAHEFIINKPDGYDTEVGERGNRLSVGEKQRISIARAILRNPRILILDEATSSVDTQTEGKIQEALLNLTKGRTTIAIAHRLSTLRSCNRLLVIEDGKIAEFGTHEELTAKKGIFYNLVMMQKRLSKVKAVDG